MSVTILISPVPEEASRLRHLIRNCDSEMARNGTQPHISLAVFDDRDTTPLQAVVGAVASRHDVIQLRLSKVGFFHGTTSVAFLEPDPNDALFRLHRDIHEVLGSLSEASRHHYHPGAWHPHLTVAFPILKDSCHSVEETIPHYDLLRVTTFDHIEVVATPPWQIRFSAALGTQ